MKANVKNQIRVPKAAEIIGQRIRKSIVKGDLKPGEFLPSETELLAHFDVSRPTLREAIRILEVEGFLSISRGARRGARIETPSDNIVTRAAGLALQLKGTSVGDVYEARMMIEPAAAKLAAERRPHEAAQALREQIAREREAMATNDLATVRLEVAHFHEVLMEQSGNSTLSVLASALKDLVEKHYSVVQSHYTKLEERTKEFDLAFRSHSRLARLIEDGDGEAAAAHWVKHLEKAGAQWEGGAAALSVVDILD